MPTYVYKNIETGETFEIRQSMRDEALTRHPETGAPVKRVLSAPGIAFRGSGFYVTDSRSKSSESKSTESKSSEPKPSESKPGHSKASEGSGGGGGSE